MICRKQWRKGPPLWLLCPSPEERAGCTRPEDLGMWYSLQGKDNLEVLPLLRRQVSVLHQVIRGQPPDDALQHSLFPPNWPPSSKALMEISDNLLIAPQQRRGLEAGYQDEANFTRRSGLA